MNEKSGALFTLVKIEDFLPGCLKEGDGPWMPNPKQTYRIIGKGEVNKTRPQQKQKIFWIIQSVVHPSNRYTVIVPENLIQGASITFMERTPETDERIRINRSKGKKGKLKYSMYRHPKYGEPLAWFQSLMYKKIKKEWVIIEVDGKAIDFE